MRRSVDENRDGVPHYQRRKIQRVLGPARQIAVELVVDAVPEVCLLEERPLGGG